MGHREKGNYLKKQTKKSRLGWLYPTKNTTMYEREKQSLNFH